MSAALIVVAAGVGSRLGTDGPKALVEVAGRTLLDHALERARAARSIEDVVVVHTPGEDEAFGRVCRAHGVERLVPGGATRSASARAGLAVVSPRHDVVAIHDAARAFTPPGTIEAVLHAVRAGAVAAAPGTPVPDTLKQVDGELPAGGARVLGTRPREGLWAVQTPQAFRREALERAFAVVGELDASDDLALVERARDAGAVEGEIRLVPGSRWGMKITYPADLELAHLLARRSHHG